MRIALISLVTPYRDNKRGTSALPYHLIKYRPSGVDIAIFTLNSNCLTREEMDEVEQELGVTIQEFPRPWWSRHAAKLLPVRVFLRYPHANYLRLKDDAVRKVKAWHPDAVWVCGEELSQITRQFAGLTCVHTLPDCESLYYRRMLQQRFVQQDKKLLWRNRVMWPKYRRMEAHFLPTVKCHLVGLADKEELEAVNPQVQAHFIRHPHYDVFEPTKVIHFAIPKIRIVIAGQRNLYMAQATDELVDALCAVDDLQQHYVITFLGKGWETAVGRLSSAGYEVHHIGFADDYKAELVRHDIQLTPITIGTGTKGKVLDALANGLLVIGTPYAMENIAVEDGKSCLVFETPQQAIDILQVIPQDVEHYEAMAHAGRECVLKHHDRQTVSAALFRLFN